MRNFVEGFCEIQVVNVLWHSLINVLTDLIKKFDYVGGVALSFHKAMLGVFDLVICHQVFDEFIFRNLIKNLT